MAITSTGSLGSIAKNTSTRTIALTTTAALTAGAIGIAVVTAPNVVTVDGSSSNIDSCFDSVGNVWTKIYEFTNGNGAAGTGVVVAVFWTKAAATLALGGTITASFTNTANAHCLSAWSFAVTAGNTLVLDTTSTLANDAADPGSIALSGLSSVERLYIRGISGESAAATALTVSAGFTAITGAQSSNLNAVRGEFLVSTSTGETSDPTWAAIDCASVFAALHEAAGAGFFTNIRVESRDAATAMLRWDYTGASDVSVWRALNGGSFSKIVTFPADYPSSSVTSFIDDSVTEQVYYDYKLSDDNGATFTSVVSVVAQKKFPEESVGAARNTRRVNLPTFATPEDVTPDSVQQMADELQAFLNGETVAAPRPCQVCPVNGALTLDCTTGCYRFIVSEADAVDVNSISINCESLELDFTVPNGTTLEVCGFPEKSGFTGDECLQAPISSGITGFQVIDKQDSECAHVRIRVPAFPCMDYTKDCYDDGSLTWQGSKYNFSHPSCSGGGISTGCCSGNQVYYELSGSSGAAIIKSGDLNIGGGPGAMAGYSMLFGRPGPPASMPWGIEISQFDVNIMGGGRPIKGKPIFGIAIHVPETATVVNFTGLVILFNYVTDQIIFGQYTNANLRSGTMPTTIASGAMGNDVQHVIMSSFPSISFGLFEVWDGNFNTVFTHSDAGHIGPSTNLYGSGFFWVGNGGFGQHIADVSFDPFFGASTSYWGS